MAEGFKLFRPEALDTQRQALLGRILINPQMAHGLMVVMVAALVATLFGFLWFAQFTPRIRAHGMLSAAALPTGTGGKPVRLINFRRAPIILKPNRCQHEVNCRTH
jgi:hypothetical protein